MKLIRNIKHNIVWTQIDKDLELISRIWMSSKIFECVGFAHNHAVMQNLLLFFQLTTFNDRDLHTVQ